MEYKIGDKIFNLEKVNLRMRDMYSKMSDSAAELSMLANEVEDAADEAEIEENDSLTPKEKAKARIRARKVFKDIDLKRKQLSEDIVKARESLLIAILEKNGYEYDHNLWYEEADVEDINNIVIDLFRRASAGKK